VEISRGAAHRFPRGVPENKTETFGPATLTTSYSVSTDGAATATLRFDSAKSRDTVAEAEALPTAIRQFRKRDNIVLSFDSVGHVLLTQGRISEGLKEYETLTTKHPKEALHRIQFASAMFDVGLCETARAEAKSATQLDPKSADALNMLAWIDEHDMVCRRFKKGWDFVAAVAAYKQAILAAPDENRARINLAILDEHGPAGYQYSPGSKLDDAITLWREIAKVDHKDADKYANNLLFDLMYAGRFPELEAELSKVSMDVTHRAMALVATTNLSGAAAAIERSRTLTSDESSRSSAMVSAAGYLLHMRKYAEASELLKVGASGQPDSANTLQRAEDNFFPDSVPRSVVQKFFTRILRDPTDLAAYEFVLPASLQGMTPAEHVQRMIDRHESGALKAAAAKAGLPLEVLTDLTLSNMKLAVEGDDKIGYRVTLQSIGSKNQVMYVVKDGGHYMFLASSSDEQGIAAQILEKLDANDVDSARKWLDWARIDMSIADGDDPLAGQMFPHLWTRGQDADPSTMRAAALSMIGKRHDVKKWIPQLIAARNHASSDQVRAYLEVPLAVAYANDENYPELKASALRLLKTYPTSEAALVKLLAACTALRDWDTLQQQLQTNLAKMPDDEKTLRLLAQSYTGHLGLYLRRRWTPAGSPPTRNRHPRPVRHGRTRRSALVCLRPNRRSLRPNRIGAFVLQACALEAEVPGHAGHDLRPRTETLGNTERVYERHGSRQVTAEANTTPEAQLALANCSFTPGVGPAST
jgi:tetratricopeptide (TPR) repeat protein